MSTTTGTDPYAPQQDTTAGPVFTVTGQDWDSVVAGAADGAEERVVVYITGDGLKTLDAVRGSFESFEVDPTVESFDSTVGATVHA